MALTGLTPIQITNLNVSGIATFEQAVGVGGTLTYQDVTNVDAVGIITARVGVNVPAGQLDIGSNIKIGNSGIATASNFKTGSSNLHSAGVEVAGVNVLGADTPIGAGATIYNSGGAIFAGTSGVVTATAFHGSGANLTNLDASDLASGTVPTARLGSGTASSSTFLAGDSTYKTVTGTTINNNADNRVITGSGTANTLNGESSVVIDSSGNLCIDAAGVGNASVYARNIFISGSSNNGITIHTTDTSGVNRKCCLFFGTGTSVADMADGMLFYDHAGQYMHLSTAGAGTGVTKSSMRLASDGTVRFDSTPTATNSISLLLKSHKARAVNDNNGILFRDASDHSQAAMYVQKKSTSDATSDLVFSLCSGQVTTTLQGIPEKFRFKSGGDLSIADGNLVIASGPHGIDFSADSSGTLQALANSFNAEILHDYEVGTFVPNIQYDTGTNQYTGSPGSGQSVSSSKGEYIRIGDMVWAAGQITLVANRNSTQEPHISIGGMPYNGLHTSQQNSLMSGWGGAAWPKNDNNGSYRLIYSYHNYTTLNFRFRQVSGNGGIDGFNFHVYYRCPT